MGVAHRGCQGARRVFAGRAVLSVPSAVAVTAAHTTHGHVSYTRPYMGAHLCGVHDLLVIDLLLHESQLLDQVLQLREATRACQIHTLARNEIH
jgi:hypothetical protein